MSANADAEMARIHDLYQGTKSELAQRTQQEVQRHHAHERESGVRPLLGTSEWAIARTIRVDAGAHGLRHDAVLGLDVYPTAGTLGELNGRHGCDGIRCFCLRECRKRARRQGRPRRTQSFVPGSD